MKPRLWSLWTDPIRETQIEIVLNDRQDEFGYETIKFRELDSGDEFFLSTTQFLKRFVPKVKWIQSWRQGRSIGKELTGRNVNKVG